MSQSNLEVTVIKNRKWKIKMFNTNLKMNSLYVAYEASFCIMRLKRFFEKFKIIKIILYYCITIT